MGMGIFNDRLNGEIHRSGRSSGVCMTGNPVAPFYLDLPPLLNERHRFQAVGIKMDWSN